MIPNHLKQAFLCMSCQENFKWHGLNKEAGHFVCPKCGVGFPSLDGFVFFTEGELFIDHIQSYYEQLRQNFWGNLSDYSYFIKKNKKNQSLILMQHFNRLMNQPVHYFPF